MAKSATFDNDLLQLIFNAVAIANLAQNGVSPITSIFVALHTGDPSAGDQTTSEAAYTGYARVGVARTSGGWTVTTNSVSPAAAINFGKCTAVPGGALTYASVGVATSGASKILYSGALNPSITMAVGVQPQIPTTATITET